MKINERLDYFKFRFWLISFISTIFLSLMNLVVWLIEQSDYFKNKNKVSFSGEVFSHLHQDLFIQFLFLSLCFLFFFIFLKIKDKIFLKIISLFPLIIVAMQYGVIIFTLRNGCKPINDITGYTTILLIPIILLLIFIEFRSIFLAIKTKFFKPNLS